MQKLLSCFESPSNIAIVKYWGKKNIQQPLNPSLSFTLSNSKTIMEVSLQKKINEGQSIDLDFFFEGKENLKFKNKIEKKLLSLIQEFPWIENHHMTIKSKNTFPHSTGIASSASSMSALAMNLVALHIMLIHKKKIGEIEFSKDDRDQASRVARLLSGSASRSVFAGAAVWGKCPALENTNDDFAIGIKDSIHPKFKTLKDAILIVDQNEKSVSSTAGHQLMDFHPHRESRIAHAHSNLEKLLVALKEGDFKTFSMISEVEALDLHAMMMTSNPPFVLLKPQSIEVIQSIFEFKKMNPECEITFTIDAGPNIHVLYTAEHAHPVETFLNETFKIKNVVKNIIYDFVGQGPCASRP